jgi:hypothetical protein
VACLSPSEQSADSVYESGLGGRCLLFLALLFAEFSQRGCLIVSPLAAGGFDLAAL